MKPISVITRILLIATLALGFTTFAFPAAQANAATNLVYLPNITKTLGGLSGWTTPIVVQNIGAQPTDATLTLYKFADGSQAAQVKTPQLVPGQSWQFDPRTNASLPNDTQFSAVVQATTGEIAATVIEGSANSWMAYSGTTVGASTVYLPNITRNLGGPDGWNTPFIVQNIGTKATTATVSFYRFDDGSLAKQIANVQLQPGRSQAFNTWSIDGLPDDTQFSVVIKGPADAQLYAIVNEASGNMAMSYEGLLGGSNVVYMPNVLKFLGGTDHWYTPFIIQNLGATATTVSVEFYSFDTGTLVTTLGGITLQPGRSKPIDVRFTPSTLPNGSYSVVVRGPAGAVLGSVVNETDPAAGMSMAYLGVGQSQAQPNAFLPFLQKNVGSAGWYSPVVAQNLGSAPATITLTLFNANGTIAGQKVFSNVRPGAAAVYDPRFDRRLPNGTYSGVVQSTANVSAIVNLSGTTTGDYAMSLISTPSASTFTVTLPATQKAIGAYTFTLHQASNADVWIESTIDEATAQRITTQTDADAAYVQTQASRLFTNIPVIYVAANEQSVATVLQTVFGYSATQAPALAGRITAMYHPQTRLTIANWAEIGPYYPQSALRHELTHAMNHQITRSSPDVPAWLDEGLALDSELSLPGSKWLQMHSQYGTASMAATGTLFTLEQLNSPILWASRTQYAGQYQYLESAQAVAMLRADIGQAGIVAILEKMGQGLPFDAAYQAVSGKPFSEFAAAFPARAKALAPTTPGIVAVSDSPIGPGMSWVAYGFAPLSLATLEVRSSTAGNVWIEVTDPYGADFGYLGAKWPSGQYKVSFGNSTTTVSTIGVRP